MPRTDPLPPVPAAPETERPPSVPSPLIRAFPTAPPPPEPPVEVADDGTEQTSAASRAPGSAEPGAAGGEGAADAARRGARAPGRREQRYQETRARIVDAAAELFAERGFDSVSVVEIAKRAGVVEKTVFNHFPMKEGLVFDADPPMREALLDAVRTRPSGESVSAAAGSFVVAAVGLLGAPEAADGVARMARVIRGSRTLQVREREILGELTDALAGLIAEETRAWPGQVEPWLAAHAVLGLYASLLELARDRVLAGVTGPELSGELRRQGRRGLALLQFGLAGYAKRR
ncbi:transcriptional regulator, TetR family [Blastococcus aggregatus]|uniref:Transcriptional regulator, TetR family n=1 Tax=Blastococcus aggregatus TaxID=38502 RepID=A0A285V5B6_9ACTN|nr:transcriptional regulator, TetR family [Blastococcus aggregatus]